MPSSMVGADGASYVDMLTLGGALACGRGLRFTSQRPRCLRILRITSSSSINPMCCSYVIILSHLAHSPFSNRLSVGRLQSPKVPPPFCPKIQYKRSKLQRTRGIYAGLSWTIWNLLEKTLSVSIFHGHPKKTPKTNLGGNYRRSRESG